MTPEEIHNASTVVLVRVLRQIENRAEFAASVATIRDELDRRELREARRQALSAAGIETEG